MELCDVYINVKALSSLSQRLSIHVQSMKAERLLLRIPWFNLFEESVQVDIQEATVSAVFLPSDTAQSRAGNTTNDKVVSLRVASSSPDESNNEAQRLVRGVRAVSKARQMKSSTAITDTIHGSQPLEYENKIGDGVDQYADDDGFQEGDEAYLANHADDSDDSDSDDSEDKDEAPSRKSVLARLRDTMKQKICLQCSNMTVKLAEETQRNSYYFKIAGASMESIPEDSAIVESHPVFRSFFSIQGFQMGIQEDDPLLVCELDEAAGNIFIGPDPDSPDCVSIQSHFGVDDIFIHLTPKNMENLDYLISRIALQGVNLESSAGHTGVVEIFNWVTTDSLMAIYSWYSKAIIGSGRRADLLKCRLSQSVAAVRVMLDSAALHQSISFTFRGLRNQSSRQARTEKMDLQLQVDAFDAGKILSPGETIPIAQCEQSPDPMLEVVMGTDSIHFKLKKIICFLRSSLLHQADAVDTSESIVGRWISMYQLPSKQSLEVDSDGVALALIDDRYGTGHHRKKISLLLESGRINWLYDPGKGAGQRFSGIFRDLQISTIDGNESVVLNYLTLIPVIAKLHIKWNYKVASKRIFVHSTLSSVDLCVSPSILLALKTCFKLLRPLHMWLRKTVTHLNSSSVEFVCQTRRLRVLSLEDEELGTLSMKRALLLEIRNLLLMLKRTESQQPRKEEISMKCTSFLTAARDHGEDESLEQLLPDSKSTLDIFEYSEHWPTVVLITLEDACTMKLRRSVAGRSSEAEMCFGVRLLFKWANAQVMCRSRLVATSEIGKTHLTLGISSSGISKSKGAISSVVVSDKSESLPDTNSTILELDDLMWKIDRASLGNSCFLQVGSLTCVPSLAFLDRTVNDFTQIKEFCMNLGHNFELFGIRIDTVQEEHLSDQYQSMERKDGTHTTEALRMGILDHMSSGNIVKHFFVVLSRCFFKSLSSLTMSAQVGKISVTFADLLQDGENVDVDFSGSEMTIPLADIVESRSHKGSHVFCRAEVTGIIIRCSFAGVATRAPQSRISNHTIMPEAPLQIVFSVQRDSLELSALEISLTQPDNCNGAALWLFSEHVRSIAEKWTSLMNQNTNGISWISGCNIVKVRAVFEAFKVHVATKMGIGIAPVQMLKFKGEQGSFSAIVSQTNHSLECSIGSLQIHQIADETSGFAVDTDTTASFTAIIPRGDDLTGRSATLRYLRTKSSELSIEVPYIFAVINGDEAKASLLDIRKFVLTSRDSLPSLVDLKIRDSSLVLAHSTECLCFDNSVEITILRGGDSIEFEETIECLFENASVSPLSTWIPFMAASQGEFIQQLSQYKADCPIFCVGPIRQFSLARTRAHNKVCIGIGAPEGCTIPVSASSTVAEVVGGYYKLLHSILFVEGRTTEDEILVKLRFPNVILRMIDSRLNEQLPLLQLQAINLVSNFVYERTTVSSANLTGDCRIYYFDYCKDVFLPLLERCKLELSYRHLSQTLPSPDKKESEPVFFKVACKTLVNINLSPMAIEQTLRFASEFRPTALLLPSIASSTQNQEDNPRKETKYFFHNLSGMTLAFRTVPGPVDAVLVEHGQLVGIDCPLHARICVTVEGKGDLPEIDLQKEGVYTHTINTSSADKFMDINLVCHVVSKDARNTISVHSTIRLENSTSIDIEVFIEPRANAVKTVDVSRIISPSSTHNKLRALRKRAHDSKSKSLLISSPATGPIKPTSSLRDPAPTSSTGIEVPGLPRAAPAVHVEVSEEDQEINLARPQQTGIVATLRAGTHQFIPYHLLGEGLLSVRPIISEGSRRYRRTSTLQLPSLSFTSSNRDVQQLCRSVEASSAIGTSCHIFVNVVDCATFPQMPCVRVISFHPTFQLSNLMLDAVILRFVETEDFEETLSEVPSEEPRAKLSIPTIPPMKIESGAVGMFYLDPALNERVVIQAQVQNIQKWWTPPFSLFKEAGQQTLPLLNTITRPGTHSTQKETHLKDHVHVNHERIAADDKSFSLRVIILQRFLMVNCTSYELSIKADSGKHFIKLPPYGRSDEMSNLSPMTGITGIDFNHNVLNSDIRVYWNRLGSESVSNLFVDEQKSIQNDGELQESKENVRERTHCSFEITQNENGQSRQFSVCKLPAPGIWSEAQLVVICPKLLFINRLDRPVYLKQVGSNRVFTVPFMPSNDAVSMYSRLPLIASEAGSGMNECTDFFWERSCPRFVALSLDAHVLQDTESSSWSGYFSVDEASRPKIFCAPIKKRMNADLSCREPQFKSVDSEETEGMVCVGIQKGWNESQSLVEITPACFAPYEIENNTKRPIQIRQLVCADPGKSTESQLSRIAPQFTQIQLDWITVEPSLRVPFAFPILSQPEVISLKPYSTNDENSDLTPASKCSMGSSFLIADISTPTKQKALERVGGAEGLSFDDQNMSLVYSVVQNGPVKLVKLWEEMKPAPQQGTEQLKPQTSSMEVTIVDVFGLESDLRLSNQQWFCQATLETDSQVLHTFHTSLQSQLSLSRSEKFVLPAEKLSPELLILRIRIIDSDFILNRRVYGETEMTLPPVTERQGCAIDMFLDLVSKESTASQSATIRIKLESPGTRRNTSSRRSSIAHESTMVTTGPQSVGPSVKCEWSFARLGFSIINNKEILYVHFTDTSIQTVQDPCQQRMYIAIEDLQVDHCEAKSTYPVVLTTSGNPQRSIGESHEQAAFFQSSLVLQNNEHANYTVCEYLGLAFGKQIVFNVSPTAVHSVIQFAEEVQEHISTINTGHECNMDDTIDNETDISQFVCDRVFSGYDRNASSTSWKLYIQKTVMNPVQISFSLACQSTLLRSGSEHHRIEEMSANGLDVMSAIVRKLLTVEHEDAREESLWSDFQMYFRGLELTHTTLLHWSDLPLFFSQYLCSRALELLYAGSYLSGTLRIIPAASIMQQDGRVEQVLEFDGFDRQIRKYSGAKDNAINDDLHSVCAPILSIDAVNLFEPESIISNTPEKPSDHLIVPAEIKKVPARKRAGSYMLTKPQKGNSLRRPSTLANRIMTGTPLGNESSNGIRTEVRKQLLNLYRDVKDLVTPQSKSADEGQGSIEYDTRAAKEHSQPRQLHKGHPISSTESLTCTYSKTQTSPTHSIVHCRQCF